MVWQKEGWGGGKGTIKVIAAWLCPDTGESDNLGSNFGSATEKLYDLKLITQPLCASVSPTGKREQL